MKTCSATAKVVIWPPSEDSVEPIASRRNGGDWRSGRTSSSNLGIREGLPVRGDVGGRVRIQRRDRHPAPERGPLQRRAQVGDEGRQRVRQLGVEPGQGRRGDLPLGPDRRQRARCACGVSSTIRSRASAPTRCAPSPRAPSRRRSGWRRSGSRRSPRPAAGRWPDRPRPGPGRPARTGSGNRSGRARRAPRRHPRPSVRTACAAPYRARGQARNPVTTPNSNSAVVTEIDLDGSNMRSSSLGCVATLDERARGGRNGLEQPADPVGGAGAQAVRPPPGRRAPRRRRRQPGLVPAPGGLRGPAGPAPAAGRGPGALRRAARHSNFSFLDGASQPEELAEEAARLGLEALALTDHDGLYGVVRFAEAARVHGLPHGLRRRAAPLGLHQEPQGGPTPDPEGRPPARAGPRHRGLRPAVPARSARRS